MYTSTGAEGSCGGANQKWTWNADGTIVNANGGTCLDIYDYNGEEGRDKGTWLCARVIHKDAHLQLRLDLSVGGSFLRYDNP